MHAAFLTLLLAPLPPDGYNVKPDCMDFYSPGISGIKFLAPPLRNGVFGSGVDPTVKVLLACEEVILKWQIQQI
jgi:hypothetical protein